MPATGSELAAFKAHLSLGETPTDFKIQVQDYKWNVHSKVLSRQSPVFEEMCDGDFKEAQEKIIKIEEDDPWVVACMIVGLYGSDDSSPYPLDRKQNELLDKMMQQGCSSSEFEAKKQSYAINGCSHLLYLYRIADKYEIKGLVAATRTGIITQMSASRIPVETVINTLGSFVLSKDQQLCESAMAACLRSASTTATAYSTWSATFKGDAAMTNNMMNFLFSRMDVARGWQKETLDSIDKAKKTCEEANLYLSYGSSKDKVHEAIAIPVKIQNNPRAF